MKHPELLSTDIFYKSFENFNQSIISDINEFKKNDIITAYAYNTNSGNLKDFNEDTITAQKIKLNNFENFYFFGVFDGHGGNGCSDFLKNNLHKNIKEFSISGIKNGIDTTEKDFLNNYAVNSNGDLLDYSGSCACFALINNKKLIIANIGDSRIIIMKNKKIFFTTKDHKPNNIMKKKNRE